MQVITVTLSNVEDHDNDEIQRVLEDVFALPSITSLSGTPAVNRTLTFEVIAFGDTTAEGFETLRHIAAITGHAGWVTEHTSVDPFKETADADA